MDGGWTAPSDGSSNGHRLAPPAAMRDPWCMMLACSGCGRFVRDESSRCPFCDTAIVHARAPLGGFLGVLVGVALAGCGTGDDDTVGEATSMTTTMTSAGSMSDATMTATTEPGTDVTGPLYGPVSDSSISDSGDSSGTSGEDSESSGGDSSGTSDSSGSSGTGDDTSGGSESVGPLYGPASG